MTNIEKKREKLISLEVDVAKLKNDIAEAEVKEIQKVIKKQGISFTEAMTRMKKEGSKDENPK